MEKRVVITGLGVCSPLDNDVENFWKKLIKGKTSIRNISETHPWLKDYKTIYGSLFEKYEFDNKRLGVKRSLRKTTGRFSQLAFEAAHSAIDDSGIDTSLDEIKENTGVVIGTGSGAIIEIEKQKLVNIKKGMREVHDFTVFQTIPDTASGIITSVYGFHATDCPVISTACASGASSLTWGFDKIKLGQAKIMLCGGTEAVCAGENTDLDPSTPSLTYAAFGNAGALYSVEDIPKINKRLKSQGTPSLRIFEAEHASRPFDKERAGFLIGEGAGIVILEEEKHAKKRGAKIYAELLGYGTSCDGASAAVPNKEGKYAAKAMTRALKMAQLNQEDIDYINAHGSSTIANGAAETAAIKLAFKDNSTNIPVSSTKSMIGHNLGAAGTIESVVSILSIRDGIIHPTKNLKNPADECKLNHVMNSYLNANVNYALSNSLGFNGHNVTLIFGKYQE